jgi:hypothetical protein
VPTSGELTFTTFGRASIFDMPPKKATVPGAALQPLDTNQDALSPREARNQNRKATSPTSGVTPGFKEQSRVHLIHAPKETTYIITECIEINVTV